MFQVCHCFKMLTGKKIIQSTFENAYWEKIIWAHANQEFGDDYLDRKITSIFSDQISTKIGWKIKNVQTFNIEKPLIHNLVNGYKRFQACQMFTGIK